MSERHVVATIPAVPEAVDAIRGAVRELATATRAGEGGVAHDLVESGAAPGAVVTVERLTDAAALDAHLAPPHVGAAFAARRGSAGRRGGGPPAAAGRGRLRSRSC